MLCLCLDPGHGGTVEIGWEGLLGSGSGVHDGVDGVHWFVGRDVSWQNRLVVY